MSIYDKSNNMKKLCVFNFVTFLLVTLTLASFAQTPEKIQQELISHIKNMKKYSAYGSNYKDALLSKEGELFKTKLLKYAKQSAVLKYNFRELSKHLDIATSEDGKFRIYSWDSEQGGTMHFFENIFQFLGSDGKVYSKSNDLEEGDAGGFVSDVFGIDTKQGKVYLARFHSILSTQDSGQSFQIFKVQGTAFKDAKLIKTNSGLTNRLSFGYNFFSVVDRPERPIKLFEYDNKTKTIKFPVVVEDEKFPNGGVTDKFIEYKFNGTYFIKVN